MFSEFEKYKNESWKNAAAHEIKGKTLEEVITWQTNEGFDVNALYQSNETEQIAYLKQFHLALAQAERQMLRNCQQIKVLSEEQANKIALEALNNGCHEICFDITENSYSNFDKLLKDILLPYCTVSFLCKRDDFYNTICSYYSYADKQKYDLKTITGGVRMADEYVDYYYSLVAIENTPKMDNLFAINIVGKEASIVERNANLLARAAKLTELLFDEYKFLKLFIGKIQFYTHLSNDYFIEIAGLRALRMLFTEIVREFGMKEYQYQQVQIHAVTSISATEREQKEPDWNMLSNTTQAMAAVIGGANAITVLPHNQSITEENNFSLRIARNVQNLLIEESYLDKTTDIGAGSYYIDTLTDKIAEQTWEKFQAIWKTL
jgi:methylmalonyl-CoA mutase